LSQLILAIKENSHSAFNQLEKANEIFNLKDRQQISLEELHRLLAKLYHKQDSKSLNIILEEEDCAPEIILRQSDLSAEMPVTELVQTLYN
jgi:hypothetical protein